MTDAERLARVIYRARRDTTAMWWCEWSRAKADVAADWIATAQAVIDSGLVTVAPEPDPAEKIADVWRADTDSGSSADVFRRMLDKGVILPGPNLSTERELRQIPTLVAPGSDGGPFGAGMDS